MAERRDIATKNAANIAKIFNQKTKFKYFMNFFAEIFARIKIPM